MFLMIDNYDSFVYNLVRYFEELGQTVRVVRNDQITLDQIACMKPEGIILSPGPKMPQDAGISLAIVKTFQGRIPLLGICLGHQIIGAAFGASIIRGERPMHGKRSMVTHDSAGLFQNIRNPLNVMRYHSLVIDHGSLPACLTVTAETLDGVVMGIRHQDACIEGVQFHPEAELTEEGHPIIRNFITMCREHPRRAEWKSS